MHILIRLRFKNVIVRGRGVKVMIYANESLTFPLIKNRRRNVQKIIRFKTKSKIK